MSKELINIIFGQTDILLFNVKTMILTCDFEFELCVQPVWKHVYHMLHSCDQWFINPQKYEEPPFHEPGLNSLETDSKKSFLAASCLSTMKRLKQRFRSIFKT